MFILEEITFSSLSIRPSTNAYNKMFKATVPAATVINRDSVFYQVINREGKEIGF